jgi:hypothetical protein
MPVVEDASTAAPTGSVSPQDVLVSMPPPLLVSVIFPPLRPPEVLVSRLTMSPPAFKVISPPLLAAEAVKPPRVMLPPAVKEILPASPGFEKGAAIGLET